jgi:hypothetical protein
LVGFVLVVLRIFPIHLFPSLVPLFSTPVVLLCVRPFFVFCCIVLVRIWIWICERGYLGGLG